MVISWEGDCKIVKAIYKIKNKVNGKEYVGQSVNPERRFTAHLSRAYLNSDNSPIHLAINKYGKENFKMCVLEWTKNYNIREKELIKYYNTMSPNGYNILPGGNAPPVHIGEKHHKSSVSDAQVEIIMSELRRGKLTQEQIGNLFTPPVRQCVIASINTGQTHKTQGIKYPINKNSPYHLSSEQISDIQWLISETLYTFSQIAIYYKVNPSAIKHINAGRNHFNPLLDYPLRKYRGKKQSQPVETILAKRSRAAIDTQLETGVCTICV